MTMQLHVVGPTGREVSVEAVSIRLEGAHGDFGLLPRHVDMTAILEPGLVSYTDPAGRENFLAVDGGTALKRGQEVWVCSPQIARGELGELTEVIERQFRQLDQREQQARQALDKMQTDFIRRLTEWQHYGG